MTKKQLIEALREVPDDYEYWGEVYFSSSDTGALKIAHTPKRFAINKTITIAFKDVCSHIANKSKSTAIHNITLQDVLNRTHNLSKDFQLRVEMPEDVGFGHSTQVTVVEVDQVRKTITFHY